MIYIVRPGPRRARRWWPTPTWRAPTARSTRTITRDADGHAPAVPAVLLPRRHPQPRRAGDARLDPRGRRARLLARRTPTAPRSTTPTCWSPASSATARPRPGRWRPAGTRNKFLNPARDGAVLPILHLNGYKIANPTVLARIPRRGAAQRCCAATATTPYIVEGDDPPTRAPAAGGAPLDAVLDADRARSRRRARAGDGPTRPRWPMIVLRTPEGLDRAEGGRRPAGRGHLARAPGAARRGPRRTPSTWPAARGVDAQLPARGAVRRGRRARSPSSPRWRPQATARMSANPHANGGLLLRDLRAARLPRLRASTWPRPARRSPRPTRVLGQLPARRDAADNPRQLPHLRPGRDRVQPARRRVRGDRPAVGWPRSCPRTTTIWPATAG